MYYDATAIWKKKSKYGAGTFTVVIFSTKEKVELI
jgi:hypothetical protein